MYPKYYFNIIVYEKTRIGKIDVVNLISNFVTYLIQLLEYICLCILFIK
jgi:hypothetical protein